MELKMYVLTQPVFDCRQFCDSRRNGPLRFIIPHRDDLPPPYSNYGPADVTNQVQPVVVDAAQNGGERKKFQSDQSFNRICIRCDQYKNIHVFP